MVFKGSSVEETRSIHGAIHQEVNIPVQYNRVTLQGQSYAPPAQFPSPVFLQFLSTSETPQNLLQCGTLVCGHWRLHIIDIALVTAAMEPKEAKCETSEPVPKSVGVMVISSREAPWTGGAAEVRPG